MRKQRNSAPVGRDPSSQPGLQVGLEATRQQKMVKEQNVSTSCQKKKKDMKSSLCLQRCSGGFTLAPRLPGGFEKVEILVWKNVNSLDKNTTYQMFINLCLVNKELLCWYKHRRQPSLLVLYFGILCGFYAPNMEALKFIYFFPCFYWFKKIFF